MSYQNPIVPGHGSCSWTLLARRGQEFVFSVVSGTSSTHTSAGACSNTEATFSKKGIRRPEPLLISAEM